MINVNRETVVGAVLLGLILCVPPTRASELPGGIEVETPNRTQARARAYGHLMRSVLAARRGDLTAAATEIRRAVELEPDSVDLLIEGAELMIWTGRRSEGEGLARRALQIEPENLRALRFIAQLASDRALGQERDPASLEEALRLYAALVRRESPADPQILGTLAQLRLAAGDTEGAIRAVQRMVDERPGDPMATRSLAQLLLQNGKKAEALELILRYVVAHPTERELIDFVDRLARSLNEWELVDRELTDGQPYPVNSGELYRLLAEARLRRGRVAEATAALESYLEADPSAPAVRQQLGLAYRSLRRMADAAEVFAALAEEYPHEGDYALMLAQVLEDQGDLVRSLQAYSAVARLLERDDPDGVRDRVLRRMASLHMARHETAEADALLESLEDAEQAEALELKARLAIARQDWSGARHAARRLRTTDEAGLASLVDAEVAVAEERWARARARFEEAIAAFGEVIRPRIAWIYQQAGQPERAAAVLRQWVAASPDDPDAHYYLGDLLCQLEDFEEGEQRLREAFRIDEEHSRSLNYLGYSLAERNVRLDEALELVQRALRSDAWNGAYLDSLGWVYYQMGRYREALGPLERAARELPADPTVLEHLGDLYARLDQGAQAIGAWVRALESGAADPDAVGAKIEHERRRIEATRTSNSQQDSLPAVEGRLEGQQPPRPQ